jgi:transposase-like protein
VQKKKAALLMQEGGDKPCEHPTFAKEYDLGERTGNFVCKTCGKTFTFREKAELIAARKG